ncbi:S1 family peptidase [Parafrankia elaeagni]|uniref:S1 family peptidase n=1 Tax=Parafrankia elaeagni TaxID=222534 RepID=UPI0012B5F5DF|nr:S1 family peptidase [Parafrankia elaeagni]
MRAQIRSACVALVAAAIPGFLSITPAGAQTQAIPDAPKICSAPDRSALAASPITAEGHRQIEDWLANPEGQAAARSVNEEVRNLGRTVLGVSADHNSQRIIVVLDSAESDTQRAAATDRLANSSFSSKIDIRTSCRPGTELFSVLTTLGSSKSWSDAKATYSFGLEPSTSTVRVVTSSDEHARALKELFGDLVEVEMSPSIGRHSRLADASPHYGAARISSSGASCTSNFTYTSNVYGTRFVATAGHCFSSGAAVTSGGNFVGNVVFRSFPNPDAEMIYAAGQTYTNRVYSDPGEPTSRVVTGKVNPGVNEYICSDGSYTLAKCGAQIINTNEQLCDSAGCTTNLTQTFNFDSFCQHGDSGGPWYQRSGSSNALASGMHVGGWAAYGGISCVLHKISTIESILQATLLTTA